MNEQKIEELKNAVRQILKMISSRVQPLSAELKSTLIKVLDHVKNRIDELRSQNPVETLPPQQPKDPELQEGMPSSNVESFGYDPKSEKLLVRFLGKYPERNGPIYGYEGVPKVIFDLFKSGAVPARTDGKNKWGTWWKGKVPSLGASLFTLIKNGAYPYQRLS